MSVAGEQCDPNAHTGVDGDVLQGERLSQRRAQLARDSGGLLMARAIEQDRELVAAQAHQQVAGPQVLAQAGADLYQQHVACLVAEAVVDLLEPVQVQQQQRLAPRLGVRHPRACLGVQGPAVRQAGQVVGGRLTA